MINVGVFTYVLRYCLAMPLQVFNAYIRCIVEDSSLPKHRYYVHGIHEEFKLLMDLEAILKVCY